LILDTVRPKVFNKRPQLEAIMPFPTPEITPEQRSVLVLAHTILNAKGRKAKKKKKNSPPETRIYFILTEYSQTSPNSLAGNCQGRRGEGRKKEGPTRRASTRKKN